MNALKFQEIAHQYNENPPIIICGCHGGGTSYVVKLLRYCGFEAGKDAGPKTRRKVHESRVFSKTNEHMILQKVLPGCSFGMRTTNENEWKEYFERIQDEQLVADIIQKINLKKMLDTYWGLDNFIKRYVHGVSGKRKKIWGWKDPRNSITINFWNKVFPDSKVLIIRKKWQQEKDPKKSKSGSWFKTQSTEYVRDIYMNPPNLRREQNEFFFFDFEEINHLQSFNELLSWLKLESISAKRHQKLLQKTDFEVRS